MVEGWIKVYNSPEEYQAILVRDILERHGLHPVLLDRKDDEFMIGEAEVYVAPEEVDKAMEIIAETEEE